MSEYQYYEFHAIDRRLTPEEDIAAARGEESSFLRRVDASEGKHARKPSLLDRMQRAAVRW